MESVATRPRLRSFVAEIMHLTWLMADQGIFALANFVSNILFVRWLSPVDYGLFAVSFTGYLLLTVFHYGAILEPLLVQSARVPVNRQRSYIATLILLHVILIGGISLLSGIAYGIACWFGSMETGLIIMGAGAGGSILVTLLTTRRLCLVFLSTRTSAMFGICYIVGVISTVYLAHRSGDVMWFDLWLIMGGWSLLCSVSIFALLFFSLSGSSPPYTLRELCKFQWQYARYGLIASTGSWIRADGLMLFLASSAGLEAIAQTRAVFNLTSPIIQCLLALNSAWLVTFSRDHNWTRLCRIVGIYCVVAALVLAVVTVGAAPLVQLFYGGRYLDGAWLLPFFCLAHLCNGMEMLLACFLKAIGSLKRGYAPQIVGCLVALAIGLTLIPTKGQVGYITAVIVSFSVGAMIAGASLFHMRRQLAVG